MGWPGHVVDIAYLNESLIKLTDAANLSNLMVLRWPAPRQAVNCLVSISFSPSLSRLCRVCRSSGASCHGCLVDVLGVLL